MQHVRRFERQAAHAFSCFLQHPHALSFILLLPPAFSCPPLPPQFLPAFRCSLQLSHALSNSPLASPASSCSLLFFLLPQAPSCSPLLRPSSSSIFFSLLPASSRFFLLLPASSCFFPLRPVSSCFLLPLPPPAVQPVSILFGSEAQGANTYLLDARGSSASFLLCCARDPAVRCCLAVDSAAYFVASVFRIRLCVSSPPVPKTNCTYV